MDDANFVVGGSAQTLGVNGNLRVVNLGERNGTGARETVVRFQTPIEANATRVIEPECSSSESSVIIVRSDS